MILRLLLIDLLAVCKVVLAAEEEGAECRARRRCSSFEGRLRGRSCLLAGLICCTALSGGEDEATTLKARGDEVERAFVVSLESSDATLFLEERNTGQWLEYLIAFSLLLSSDESF